MVTDREVGLGDARLYCSALRLRSIRWPPVLSSTEVNKTIMFALRQLVNVRGDWRSLRGCA